MKAEKIGDEREGDFMDNFNAALQEAPFSVSLCTANTQVTSDLNPKS